MSCKFMVLLGNFGSGKSELALNFALNRKNDEKIAVVDLDLINPYFRISDRKELLSAGKIKLISPLFANKNVEIMTLPPDIFSVFNGFYDLVIFDVGGDAGGAVALGQYYHYFEQLPPDSLEVYLVVNPRRPLSDSVGRIIALLEQIELSSRLKITALINNGNLSTETTAADLLFAYPLLKEVSQQTGIPVAFTSGSPSTLQAFLQDARESLSPQYIGQPLYLTAKMYRDWQSYIQNDLPNQRAK